METLNRWNDWTQGTFETDVVVATIGAESKWRNRLNSNNRNNSFVSPTVTDPMDSSKLALQVRENRYGEIQFVTPLGM